MNWEFKLKEPVLLTNFNCGLNLAASLRFLTLFLIYLIQWHIRCSTVFLSSSSHFLHSSLWTNTSLNACEPTRQWPVYITVISLHWARLSDNRDLVFFKLNGPHMFLAILLHLIHSQVPSFCSSFNGSLVILMVLAFIKLIQ